MFEKVWSHFLDRHKFINDVARDVRVDQGAEQSTLTDEIQMHKVSAYMLYVIYLTLALGGRATRQLKCYIELKRRWQPSTA